MILALGLADVFLLSVTGQAGAIAILALVMAYKLYKDLKG